MRRFAQIEFPPWVRTYPKSTSAKFFVPTRTLIAVKLLYKEMDGLKQVCRIVQHRGQYQFQEVDFFSYIRGPRYKTIWGGPDQLAGNSKERPRGRGGSKTFFFAFARENSPVQPLALAKW